MTRTEFLRQQTVSAANKCCRAPLPAMSVANAPCSLPERKALALKEVLERMPVYIGPKELIVGTRTFYAPNPGNEDGHNVSGYGVFGGIPYVTQEEIQLFGKDMSYVNKSHFTPDFGIILDKGIDGILADVKQKQKDPTLHQVNRDFLSSVAIAYEALRTMILRYGAQAKLQAAEADPARRQELLEIARICQKVSAAPPDTFHEALQLLRFAQLGAMIESFEFVNYGRLDVLLGRFLKDTPREKARQLIECLLLKMYDQVDLEASYLGNYAAQLTLTLGGVLPNGESAVNEVTMLFLEAVENTRLPEPEFNLRLNSKNPPEFLDKAAQLTIQGCNFISYFNDDQFIANLHAADIPLEDARNYSFDVCQDIHIPGKGDFWQALGGPLIFLLMDLLKEDHAFATFADLLAAFKKQIAAHLDNVIGAYIQAEEHLALYAQGNTDAFFKGIREENKPAGIPNAATPMAPLPLLSGLYHGCIENALDQTLAPMPIKHKGLYFGSCVEAANSLAAIKKVVYDEKRFTLEQVYQACENNFSDSQGKLIRSLLWNSPKWGNDDDYVDMIAKDLIEFALKECHKYRTFYGGRILSGVHQPHIVLYGTRLMATPEGRPAGAPITVTLTPESGTMKNGVTAAFRSAVKLDNTLLQWNCCIMMNYFASVFQGNNGAETFKALLNGFFRSGGLQHQPNVSDVEAMKRAKLEPEKYKDLVVRLWGVSAHFVDLPAEMQDEMIARFSA